MTPTNTTAPRPTATVSRLPYHNGDGYSWGGDVLVTFGERSIFIGTNQDDMRFARELADAWNAKEPS